MSNDVVTRMVIIVILVIEEHKYKHTYMQFNRLKIVNNSGLVRKVLIDDLLAPGLDYPDKNVFAKVVG